MRRIDHIVVAVRELDQAADLYRRLGFQVGPRNRHPWGTENRLIQFGSTFIELITAGNAANQISPHRLRRFSFGAFVRDYLDRGEGIAMLVLSSVDGNSDAAQFAELRIGDFEPFSFERNGRKPDGSKTHVAFTLAFAKDPVAPGVGFFVCQQHFPENFWSRSFQRHPNSATNIAAVTLTAPRPSRHSEFLMKFSGAGQKSLPDSSIRFVLDEGQIEVVPAPESQMSSSLTSFSVRVDEIETVINLLKEQDLPFTTSCEGMVHVSTSLFGVHLSFRRQGIHVTLHDTS